MEWLTAQGVRFAPGGIRKGAAGYDVTFIHPKGNECFKDGVIVLIIRTYTASDKRRALDDVRRSGGILPPSSGL